ncbi:outer membrane protein assembly factor BamB family protein [Pontiella sulfatireligans]|nr:PQQ-binding-like beta-propeller repeat protein [Pontiella sulfatireligans]
MKLYPYFFASRGALVLAGIVFCGLNAGAQGWPEFRGPEGRGLAEKGAKLPLNWSETSNVSWKTAIPHVGWSTPVALDGQLWLSSATEDGHDFYAYCVDAETGKMLFEKHLFHCDEPEVLGNSVNCYASPSAALEPGRVYMHFGSYGTACLDTATAKVLWKRDDMPCRHYRGPGSSAILHEDLLILTFDGVDQQYITALDKKTGKTVWRTERTTEWTDWDENGKPKRDGDFRKAFATPIIVKAAGKEQLLCPASSCVFAYDPRTGKELWKVPHSGHSASVSPVYGKGLVLAATGAGTSEILGIRPDGNGDVSGSHVAWRFAGKDVPTTPSPLVVDDLFFMVSNRGTLTCLEAETGKSVWRERAGGNYIASPIHCGDRIYFFSNNGKTTVVRAGRVFEQLAENQLDDGFMASPVALGDSLILRTKTHLYRIEER